MLQPGDVVEAEFPGAQGVKKRPCLVISGELYHQTRPDVLLSVITSNLATATAPTDWVLRDWQEAGLSLPSAARIYISARLQYQVTKIGRLSDDDWNKVQNRLKLALEI